MGEKQYAGFVADAPTLDRVRQDAPQDDGLYAAHSNDSKSIQIDPVTPVDHTGRNGSVRFQTNAAFYHRPRGVEDIVDTAYTHDNAERRTAFFVEKVVVLSGAEYEDFKRGDLAGDQIFLFDNQDKMWFDPAASCWHCLLVKGENSKDGILVDSEGYSYARYAAYAPDCSRLMLKDIPVQYEYPAKPPKEKAQKRSKYGLDR